jgi:opacity protein-like surface antigen
MTPDPIFRILVALVLLLSAAGSAQAQQPVPPDPDFLFERPDGSLALRGSWIFARAGSDLFDFVEEQLTIEKRNFNRAAFAADYGIAITPRTDAVIGVEVNRASVPSEYRNLVDNNRQPIEQTTSLTELNLTGNVRFALTSRGREIGRFAWVPSGVVPYVGAGGGALWYRFQQSGDFVDALDPRRAIFTDTFRAQGWTPSAQVFAGVDVKLRGRWFLTLDGRYLWAAGALGNDFEGFDPIDLAGFRAGAGINILF